MILPAAALLPGCGRQQAAIPPLPSAAPPVVQVVAAKAMDGPAFSEAVATLDGSSSLEVKSPVAGYLIKQVYADGAPVKKGELLFLIDAKVAGGYTRITSPMTGVVERSVPGAGDSVRAGMTLTSVFEVDPIRADFALPRPADRDQAALPPTDQPDTVELILDDGTTYAQRGRLYYGDREAKAIAAYALFPNPDRMLRPGQYAKVRGSGQTKTGAVMILNLCVVQDQGVDVVRVVRSDNTVEFRHVTVGYRGGSSCEVLSGLTEGERVMVGSGKGVSEGLRVKPELYEQAPDGTPPNR